MGIKSALETLDDKILSMYTKVAHKAHKELGLSKWDMYKRTGLMVPYSTAGIGLFGIVGAPYSISLPLSITALALSLPIGIIFTKIEYSDVEKKELEDIARTGAAKKSKPKWHRPLATAFSYACLIGGYFLGTQSYQTSDSMLTSGLVTGFLGLEFLAFNSASYFKDTPMLPPKSKRSMFKAIGNYFSNKTKKLRRKPRKEPAANYAPLKFQYAA